MTRIACLFDRLRREGRDPAAARTSTHRIESRASSCDPAADGPLTHRQNFPELDR